MPELPDLEVISHNLNQRLAGHTLKAINVAFDKKLNVSKAALEEALANKKLKKIYREGKELRMEFTGDRLLGLHLMLHGEFQLSDEEADVKFPIVKFDFGKNGLLTLSDFQRLAAVTLDPEPSDVVDALDLDEEGLMQLLSRKKAAIKRIFMDQHLIRGIGNAYADEIFYDAGISPFSIANKIPKDGVAKLVRSTKKVLNNAVKQILKADPDRISGENRKFMKVHLPKKASTSKDEEILVEKQGARKTYYVKSQILYQ